MFFPLMHRKFLPASFKRISAGENLFLSSRQKFNIKSCNACRDLLFFYLEVLFLKIVHTGVRSFLHHSVHLLHFFASIPASFAGSGFIAAVSFSQMQEEFHLFQIYLLFLLFVCAMLTIAKTLS